MVKSMLGSGVSAQRQRYARKYAALASIHLPIRLREWCAADAGCVDTCKVAYAIFEGPNVRGSAPQLFKP